MPKNPTYSERVCAHCEQPYTCRSDTKQRYCSRSCRGLASRTIQPTPCQRCGAPIRVNANSAARDWGKFCSRECYRQTPFARFWAYVEQTPTCWRWTGYTIWNGYGRLRWSDGRMVLAHRASWEIHNGPIPDGKLVLHKCDGGGNRWCVNPDHLALGDYGENAADAIKAGRHYWSLQYAQHVKQP